MPKVDIFTVHKYKDAEAVVVFVDSRVDREVIDQLPKLRLIITRSTGYDHIDVKHAVDRGVIVCNVPDYASITVAEYTIALMLALSRRLKETVQRTSGGTFSREGLSGFDLSGKTLGVIGTGKIGRYVVKLAHAFDMRIIAYDMHCILVKPVFRKFQFNVLCYFRKIPSLPLLGFKNINQHVFIPRAFAPSIVSLAS